ncbi:MAG: type VI secretion system baseplate subunit TssG [Fibromonadaceae bacterium]|jgi:hypothetical protein|nr:type VI secretion system baseplate subunit TssG [Fibromonadaceae bacterium]
MGVKKSVFEWLFSWFSNKNEKTLCIIGSNSLKHPSGDIDFVETRGNEVVLALNEMSLCGADSPLPDSFLRGIRTEREDSVVLADFLNMLQHHLAMLRFNAILEKSSFLMHGLESDKWQNRFALYNEKFSPESLRCFFVKIFPDCKIEVHCFEPLKIENPAPFFLGRSNLNENLLGEICTSLTQAMRVDISELPLEQSIELKKNKDFLNVKFPFKIKVNFSSKSTFSGKNLSENFWLGSKNFENFKWERWV